MKKYYLHSLMNRILFYVLLLIFFPAYFFIGKDAYNFTMMVIGFIVLSLFLFFVIFIFIYKFKVLDFLVFTDNEIILSSYFKKNINYNYRQYFVIIGLYISVIENKKAIIFNPLDGPFAKEVDTSKFGNTLLLNKHMILYCQYDDKLYHYLEEKYKKISSKNI